ncbi:sigma-70 family RNA polymerase sigma factor [Chitinophaga agrisoli]|uniref:Sigma-70 family RNA polymerase sigma factor n=1 Tax=Chitinophaga agrisoli TaxID=2607653 RepID=A0A5B2VJR4_9BACT|nr:sigma-70 family RNA polymerase sigma factor [Chitinophaga agrisoli]KAA2238786.1 sigma-70 family RNA polymerase sigma factor [Chitinophaga agrisoli]
MPVYEQDLILLTQLKAGNTGAFADFYEKYRKYLMVVAISLLDDEMEAQDLVQEFFIDFWEKKLYAKIDPDQNKREEVVIKNYVHRIIFNRCMDRLGLRKTRQRRMDSMPTPEVVCPPENRLEAQERQQQLGASLAAAINKVPPLSAKVFELAYIQHKSRTEIATVMGVSPNTVKNQLVRAVKILRTQLKKV